jgi:hypothetical protein
MIRLLGLLLLASTTMAVSAPSDFTFEVRAATFREWSTAKKHSSLPNHCAVTLASDVRALSVRFMSPSSNHVSMGLALTYGTRHGDPNRRFNSDQSGVANLPMHYSVGVPIVYRRGICELGAHTMLTRGPYRRRAYLFIVDGMRPSLSYSYDSYREQFKYIVTPAVELEGGIQLIRNLYLSATYRLTAIIPDDDPDTRQWFAQGIGLSLGSRTDLFTPSRGLFGRKWSLRFRSMTLVENFPDGPRHAVPSYLGGSTKLTLAEIGYLVPLDNRTRIGVSAIIGARMSEPNGDYPEKTSPVTYGVGVPIVMDIGRIELGMQPSYTRGPYRIAWTYYPDPVNDYQRRARERFADRFVLNMTLSAGLRVTRRMSVSAVYRLTPMGVRAFDDVQRRVEGFGVSIAYRFVR